MHVPLLELALKFNLWSVSRRRKRRCAGILRLRHETDVQSARSTGKDLPERDKKRNAGKPSAYLAMKLGVETEKRLLMRTFIARPI